MTEKDFPAWVGDLIGKPYAIGGRGPDSFDCWGLVRYFYFENYGISLPLYQNENPFDTKRVGKLMTDAEHCGDWNEFQHPEHGDVVAMGRSKILHHVGIWLDIDGGMCLHALGGQSVIAQNKRRLKREGFKRISFFSYGKSIQGNKSR